MRFSQQPGVSAAGTAAHAKFRGLKVIEESVV